MSYNISETSGNFTGSGDSERDVWTFDATLADLNVKGDFDVDNNLDGVGEGEATSGYSFSALSTNAYGSLNFNKNTGKFTFTINHAAVIASGSDQVVEFTVTGRSGINQDTDKVVIKIAICVQRGTKIDTSAGSIAVEDLEVGNCVLTLDSGYQPIRWIGSRQLRQDDLALAPELRPIRICAGALGRGSPIRDLLVSPQHRVLITGWKAELYFGESEILVPAKGLVNDHDIMIARDVEDVEYFHVLFDRHEIMVTDGAPTESFFPGEYVVDELSQSVQEELTKIFPQLVDNPDKFGRSARSSVKSREAVVLSRGVLQ